MEQGTLFIQICAGRNLASKDLDTFCNIYLLDQNRVPLKSTKQKTKIVKKAANPEWNENLEFFVTQIIRGIEVELRSKGRFKSSHLGAIFIPFEELKTFDEKENWFIIQKGEKKEPGDILIRYRFAKAPERKGEELTSAQKQQALKLNKLFNAPSDERVLEKLSCAYHGKVLLQGTMYITQQHLFFYSLAKKIKIRLSNIKLVEKKSTVLLIPTALKIILVDDRELTFSNIFNRDKICTLIIELRAKFNDADELSSRSEITDIFDEDPSETSSVEETWALLSEKDPTPEDSSSNTPSGKSERPKTPTNVVEVPTSSTPDSSGPQDSETEVISKQSNQKTPNGNHVDAPSATGLRTRTPHHGNHHHNHHSHAKESHPKDSHSKDSNPSGDDKKEPKKRSYVKKMKQFLIMSASLFVGSLAIPSLEFTYNSLFMWVMTTSLLVMVSSPLRRVVGLYKWTTSKLSRKNIHGKKEEENDPSVFAALVQVILGLIANGVITLLSAYLIDGFSLPNYGPWLMTSAMTTLTAILVQNAW